MPRIRARGCARPYSLVIARTTAHNAWKQGAGYPSLDTLATTISRRGAKLPCRSGLPALICWSNVSLISTSGTRTTTPWGHFDEKTPPLRHSAFAATMIIVLRSKRTVILGWFFFFLATSEWKCCIFGEGNFFNWNLRIRKRNSGVFSFYSCRLEFFEKRKNLRSLACTFARIFRRRKNFGFLGELITLEFNFQFAAIGIINDDL